MAIAKSEPSGSVLLRTLLVAATIIATVGLGAMAGTKLFANDHWAKPLSDYRPILVAVFLVLGIAMLGVSMPAVVKFIRCGWHHFLACLRQLSPALAFLLLSALSAVPTPTPHIGVSEQVATLGIQFGHRGGAHDVILVPFFEKVNPEASARDCNPGRLDFGEASAIQNRKVIEAIEYLTESLKACSKPPRKQVVIDVQGFASTSAFNGCDKLPIGPDAIPISEQLNWTLAEKRRTAVIKIVREKDPDRLLSIEPAEGSPRWTGPQQMRARLRFDDTGDSEYDRIRGALNRRVEIVIRNKGICDPDVERQQAEALE